MKIVYPTVPEKSVDGFTFRYATEEDREEIYRLRHQVYVRELAQYPGHRSRRLQDPLDAGNVYITACHNDRLVGFVSITPPSSLSYSIDKYFHRNQLPIAFDKTLYEVRILTVLPEFRGTSLAGLLMYAALRWVVSRGGQRIVALGRHEVLDIYLKVGLQPLGREMYSGAVHYHLLQANVADLEKHLRRFDKALFKYGRRIDWQLDIPYERPAACFHGGAFFEAVGESFDHLESRKEIINADVLDAWFSPSPEVTAAMKDHLDWMVRTSPPTSAAGMIQAVAEARGVEPMNILPGSGSSSLIFLAFPQLLDSSSRVLILDPTYGEYAHVLEQVIGCHVDRFVLDRSTGYRPDQAALQAWLEKAYDLVVLVNPNSPTGGHLPRRALEAIILQAPSRTRFWIDETYIDYAGRAASLERFAVRHPQVIVCKSMSKVYALSGVRAAYLCAAPQVLETLRSLTPPWAVSLPGQVAAVKALSDPFYYQAQYSETHRQRRILQDGLSDLGFDVVSGVANFLLFHLPKEGMTSVELVEACRLQKLYLRDASPMGKQMGDHAVRMAVKDPETNQVMLSLLRKLVLRQA